MSEAADSVVAVIDAASHKSSIGPGDWRAVAEGPDAAAVAALAYISRGDWRGVADLTEALVLDDALAVRRQRGRRGSRAAAGPQEVRYLPRGLRIPYITSLRDAEYKSNHPTLVSSEVNVCPWCCQS